MTLELVGYGSMGLRVTNYVAVESFLDRRASQLPDFQTFYPDSQFMNLYRVDVLADSWSLDNVVLGGVPEPSVGGLLVLGILFGLGSRWARIRRSSRGAAVVASH